MEKEVCGQRSKISIVEDTNTDLEVFIRSGPSWSIESDNLGTEAGGVVSEADSTLALCHLTYVPKQASCHEELSSTPDQDYFDSDNARQDDEVQDDQREGNIDSDEDIAPSR